MHDFVGFICRLFLRSRARREGEAKRKFIYRSVRTAAQRSKFSVRRTSELDVRFGSPSTVLSTSPTKRTISTYFRSGSENFVLLGRLPWRRRLISKSLWTEGWLRTLLSYRCARVASEFRHLACAAARDRESDTFFASTADRRSGLRAIDRPSILQKTCQSFSARNDRNVRPLPDENYHKKKHQQTTVRARGGRCAWKRERESSL